MNTSSPKKPFFLPPTALCFVLAFYVVCATSWPPLWAALPFIVFVIVYRARRIRAAKCPVPGAEKVEPVMPITSPSAPPPLTVEQEVEPVDKAPSRAFDPMTSLHPVFTAAQRDWSEFQRPAFERRGISIPWVAEKSAAAQASELTLLSEPDEAAPEPSDQIQASLFLGVA